MALTQAAIAKPFITAKPKLSSRLQPVTHRRALAYLNRVPRNAIVNIGAPPGGPGGGAGTPGGGTMPPGGGAPGVPGGNPGGKPMFARVDTCMVHHCLHSQQLAVRHTMNIKCMDLHPVVARSCSILASADFSLQAQHQSPHCQTRPEVQVQGKSSQHLQAALPLSLLCPNPPVVQVQASLRWSHQVALRLRGPFNVQAQCRQSVNTKIQSSKPHLEVCTTGFCHGCCA